MKKRVIIFNHDFILPHATKKLVLDDYYNKSNLRQLNISNEDVLVLFKVKPNHEHATKGTETDFFLSRGVVCDVKSLFNDSGEKFTAEFVGKEIVEVQDVELVVDQVFATSKPISCKAPTKEETVAASRTLKDALSGKLVMHDSTYFETDFSISNIREILSNPESKKIQEAVNICTCSLNTKIDHKYKYIYLENVLEKIKELAVDLESIQKMIALETELQTKIKRKLDEQQKEFYLREKMSAIKEELDGDVEDEVDEWKTDFENNPYPESIKKKALSEIRRYEITPPASAESGVIRTYIEWLHDVPWWQKDEENIDLAKVKADLDAKHFGLEKVKERIVEHLAVQKKTKSLDSPIICLVGPPGVGKTSLASSIAEAIGRKFVKISLGGVSDEPEIRGHRRTYVGSMPGRIITAMKKVKVINPLILLDEIDKLSRSGKGDPTSALLEVLDPEQNKKFNDHYLEENYDLSNVMFIATANYIGNIPPELRDRIEMIDVSSYTEQEKMAIAKQHLIPKIVKKYNLKASELKISDTELLFIIQKYTREAGVRELERLVNKLARKVVVGSFENENMGAINHDKVLEYLSKPKYSHSKRADESQVGVVSGLAYTQFGGDILPIEVNITPGKGKLALTGQLGDVMKESAHIAFTFVKSNYEKFKIDKEVFVKNDFHIHAPEGAVPKDGPSAGITITTALISVLTNKKVSNEIGMTGEITLRGNVLPIGGLKEKSISAHRSGLKKILAPYENEKDLDEIPDEVKKDLKIEFVKQYDEVFDKVFNTK